MLDHSQDPSLRRTLEWRGEDVAEAPPQLNLDDNDPEPERVIADAREQLTLTEAAAITAEAPADPEPDFKCAAAPPNSIFENSPLSPPTSLNPTQQSR
jgi:hypothetical protein